MNRTGTRQSLRIYARTAGGEREVVARELPLGQSARRILMLIDGKRSVRELSRLARPGELDTVLALLGKHALVEAVAAADEPTESQQQALALKERERLRRLKESLQNTFASRLDAAGHIWDARIADAVNDETLRRVLREAIDMLQRRCGSETAQEVLAQVRASYRRS